MADFNAEGLKSNWIKSKACVNCKKRKIVRFSNAFVFQPSSSYSEMRLGYSAMRTLLTFHEFSRLRVCRIWAVDGTKAGRQVFLCRYPPRPTSAEQIAGVEARIRSLSRSPHRAPTPLPPTVQDLPPPVLEELVVIFLRRPSQLGFFLDSAANATPALRTALCVCAIHYARSTSNNSAGQQLDKEYEALYLARALRATADALAPLPPSSRPQSLSPYAEQTGADTILHTIQAHVLLATYFFRNVRPLEGKYHLGAAVGLVLGAGMHRRPGRRSPGDHQRSDAFWAVYTLDCCWMTVDASTSNFTSEIQGQVDIPWPRENAHGPSGMGTITAFLNSHSVTGVTPHALHAKAAILFERASRLIQAYHPNMPPADLNSFLLAFTNIDTVIQQFRQLIPQQPRNHAQLLVYVLAGVAAIQLHNPFVGEANTSRQRAISAARDVVTALANVPRDGTDSSALVVDPIMGVLLLTTGQALITAILFARKPGRRTGPAGHRQSWSRDGHRDDEAALRAALDQLLEIMRAFAVGCKLMATHLRTLKDVYRGALG
ncbi:Zn(2)-C6 fungal-type domain-containing protein [Mycena kentingensis (nom. inval.)]|nr:Zn(2)-C6 fungal-type domain-containing protein [Mycena kentingensis (nom. inval.)]